MRRINKIDLQIRFKTVNFKNLDLELLKSYDR